MSIVTLVTLFALAATPMADTGTAPSTGERPSAPAPAAPPASTPAAPAEWKNRSMHTIEVQTLEGEKVSLSKYSGKVMLIVNVASACGLTPQYAGLQKLSDEFKEAGLVVLAFPSNDFGGQEPGTAEEIRSFCTTKYSVTFPIFAKCGVKAGPTQSPVYTALQAKTDKLPAWNFGKYVVSRDGTSATLIDSRLKPESEEMREAIKKALAGPMPSAKPDSAPAATQP